MKELPSPIHAERMKVAQFSSLERFRTEELVFGNDCREATDARADDLTITGEQPTGTTDETTTKTRDIQQSSDLDSDDEDLTSVDVATLTSNSQGHDIRTGPPGDQYDKRHSPWWSGRAKI